MSKKKEFNPTAVTCKKCKDSIKSSFPGEFVRCKCGASFCDQTHYYSRYGGEVDLLDEFKD